VLPAVCAVDRVSIPVPPTASAADGLAQLLEPSGQQANVEAAA
jgi:cellulose biosynthesis protein BcsQ